MAGNAGLTRNHAGGHFLSDRRVAAELVRRAGVRPGDLVLDFGAGRGAITAPLVAAGAHVVAVERDQRLSASLARRFAGRRVTVVNGDLRLVPLPRRPYRVVASIPFATTAAVLRRLLDDPASALLGADLLVELGAARRLATPRPRDLATAWWLGRYEARLERRVAAGCFRPAPRVDAAHLAVRPRALAADARGQRLLRALLAAAFARPNLPLLVVAGPAVRGAGLPHRRLHRALAAAGLAPGAPATSPTGAQWHDLVAALLAPDGRPGPAGSAPAAAPDRG